MLAHLFSKKNSHLWIGGFLATAVIAAAVSTWLNPPHVYGPDTRRMADVRQVQLALALYADNHDRTYPIFSPGCHNIGVLEEHLVPTYFNSLPHDPQLGKSWPDYRYAVLPDGKRFVIVAILRKTDHTALQFDLDGTILDCNCNDPSYCVDGTIDN